jgi:hypothetical protein
MKVSVASAPDVTDVKFPYTVCITLIVLFDSESMFPVTAPSLAVVPVLTIAKIVLPSGGVTVVPDPASHVPPNAPIIPSRDELLCFAMISCVVLILFILKYKNPLSGEDILPLQRFGQVFSMYQCSDAYRDPGESSDVNSSTATYLLSTGVDNPPNTTYTPFLPCPIGEISSAMFLRYSLQVTISYFPSDIRPL